MTSLKEYFANDTELFGKVDLTRVDEIVAALERACVDRAAMRQM